MQNYRSISLTYTRSIFDPTCTLCKTMESIIKDNMLPRLVDNNLFDKNQHDFLPGHSIASQLLECHYDVLCE